MSKFIRYGLITGCIPEELFIASKEKTKIIIPYIMENGEVVEGHHTLEVKPSFATNNANPKTIETAKKWASNYDRKDYTSQVRKNEPFSNVTIVDIDIRDEGGRAYKVVTEDGLYFDLREDTLLNAIYMNGVGKGGKLQGEFIWAVVGSQMKIIVYNSDLYKHLSELTNLKKNKKITSSKWEEGGLYKGLNGTLKLYLGVIDYTDFLDELTSIKKVKQHLWCSISHDDNDNPISEMYKSLKGELNKFEIRTYNNLVEKTDQYEIPRTFFKDLHIAYIDAVENKKKNSEKYIEAQKVNSPSYYKNFLENKSDFYKCGCYFYGVTIRPHGEKVKDISEYMKTTLETQKKTIEDL